MPRGPKGDPDKNSHVACLFPLRPAPDIDRTAYCVPDTCIELRLSLSQIPSGWRWRQNRIMLSSHVGSLPDIV